VVATMVLASIRTVTIVAFILGDQCCLCRALPVLVDKAVLEAPRDR
jgi:hypothetical protein